MAKIPTYESRRTPTGRVARPNLPDYSVELAQKVVRAGNKVLDAQAVDEGYKAGKEEQAKAFEETQTLVQKEGYTLRSDAYNKGANASYIAGMKTKAEDDISAIAQEINDPLSKVPIEERLTTYNEKVAEVRNDYVANIPSHLQGDLSNYFDSYNKKFESSVFNNQRNMQIDDIKATISQRVDTALENIPALIRDNGYADNEALEESFSDIVAAIDEGLQFVSPSLAEAYKEKIRTVIQYSSLEKAYELAEDKEAFIEDLENGGDIYKSIMADVNETYFDGGDQLELTPNGEGGYKTLAKRLQIQLNNDKSDMALDRWEWEKNFTTNLSLYKEGAQPDFGFDKDEMKALGFSDVQIAKYEEQYVLAQEIYPDIVAAKGTSLNDNSTNLKTLKKDYFDLLNKENLTDDDKQDLIVMSAQIDEIGKILSFQREALTSGDANLILDMAGIQYDTTTEEGINAYHNKLINQFGLSEDVIKLVPQSQLDADSELMTDGSWQDIMGLKQKYGKYFERFVADAELIKNGYQTVAIYSHPKINPAYAEQIFNAVNDLEKNIKTAKNIDSNFSGEDGALTEFEDFFQENYTEYLIGNVDYADDVMNAARAMFVQTYIRTGDTDKAMKSINKMFEQGFNKFEYNDMKVLLPKTIDPKKIEATIKDFIEHPQQYGIHTGSNFDINDFKDDMEDNTSENYSLAYDGGAIKIVNKENAMGIVTIFKRLPSGKGEIVYTNSINITENNEEVDGIETKDTVEIWDFDAVLQDENADEVVVDENAISEIVIKENTLDESEQDIDVEIKEEKIVETKTFADAVDEKIASNVEEKKQEVEAYETQIKDQQISLKDKYAEFDTDGDGQISGDELLKAKEFADSQPDIHPLAQPKGLEDAKQIEDMLLIYSKLDNPPQDLYVGTISSDARMQPVLQAISMYVKDGNITEFIIHALSELESFKGLNNNEVASEVLLNWKDNMERTTKTKPATRMTPIQALYDYVRVTEVAVEKKRIEANIQEWKEYNEKSWWDQMKDPRTWPRM